MRPADSTQALAKALPVLPDIGKPAMAKVVVRPADIGLVKLGHALAYAIGVARWSSKEAAARIGVDDAEFGKWLSGNRRTQVDKVIDVDELQWHFVVGLARECGHEVIETIRRRHPLPLAREEE